MPHPRSLSVPISGGNAAVSAASIAYPIFSARCGHCSAAKSLAPVLVPLGVRGSRAPGRQALSALADAAAVLDLPIELVDERFTTAEAERTGAIDLDAGAAAIILEDFFAQRRRS